MSGAGRGRYTGQQSQAGQGVHGVGGGQTGWQQAGGGGHVYQHGPVPHGKIAGQVGAKLQQAHIMIQYVTQFF